MGLLLNFEKKSIIVTDKLIDMKKLFSAAVVLFCCMLSFAASSRDYALLSPDGKMSVCVQVGDGIIWSLNHSGDAMIKDSPISMTLSDGVVYGDGDKVVKVIRRSVDDLVKAHIYKKSHVKDTFNEMTLKFKEFSLIFRAYDEGVAYRFISHSKKPFEVISEQAVFAFAQDWNMWVPYVRQNLTDLQTQKFNSFENRYEYHPLSEWNKERLAFLPLMVDGPSGKKISIAEADLLNFPGMFLYNSGASSSLEGVYAQVPEEVKQGGHHNLQMLVKSRKDYIAKFDGAVSFPWRIVAVSENDIQMADNDLVWKLATPAEDRDWSWVKPGKVAWDWWNAWNLYGVDFRAGINNDTYKYYIDFASKYGIEYIILDEGWAVNNLADLFQVVPEINLEELVAYGKQKNVGLILWAGFCAFDRDMEKVCRHYSQMGIKGFKVDFMNRDDQTMVDFYRRAAETAARHGLLLDFHGAYKPTGLHRTYPNVVNFEGVFGLEQMKWAKENVDMVTYDVTMPFIRMMAGPVDYTQGAMRNATRKNYRPVNTEAMSQGTRCRQLAEYVIFDSPLNMLCDSPSNYMREEECTKFIASVPVVWDETRGIEGKVGEYITIARRSGDVWYVGAMTGWDARTLEIDLGFLPDGSYSVEMFRDGINADRAACDYRREVLDLPSDRRLHAKMAPGGGFVARIIKK